MQPNELPDEGGQWSRAGLLRAALAGGAAVAGGAAIGARRGNGASYAARSKDTDAEILGLFLLIERLQEDFYRGAVDAGRLDGDLRAFAETVLKQEEAHGAFLARRLGERAGARPKSDFGDALRSRETFRSTAIDLEETAIAAYVGQGANLTAGIVATVATLVSVEARQAAWIRDLAGQNPAPNAADPARKPAQVLSELRDKGYLR